VAVSSNQGCHSAYSFNSFPIHRTGSLHLSTRLYVLPTRVLHTGRSLDWSGQLCRPPMALDVVLRLGYGHSLTTTGSDSTGLTQLQVQGKMVTLVFFLGKAKNMPILVLQVVFSFSKYIVISIYLAMMYI